jgi:hypothetical protein
MISLRARALATAVLLAGSAPALAAPLALPEGALAGGNLIRVQSGGGDNAFSDTATRREQRREDRRLRAEFDRRTPEARYSRPSYDSGRYERHVDRSSYDRRIARAGFDRPSYNRAGYYNGYRGSREWRRGHRYHNGWWFPLAAFATGALVGGAFAAAPPVYAYPAPTYVVPGTTYIEPPPTIVHQAPTYVQPGPTIVHPAPAVQLSQAHVDWCRAHYRSYDARTDTFKPYHGPRKRCESPYA